MRRIRQEKKVRNNDNFRELCLILARCGYVSDNSRTDIIIEEINMVIIDWHISCDKEKKRCILYEDKEEKYPAVEFIAKEGFVEIKEIPPRHMQIEGRLGGRIIGRAELTI